MRDETLMVHFTCDLCGKDLTATSEARQVVLHDSHHDVRTPLPAQS